MIRCGRKPADGLRRPLSTAAIRHRRAMARETQPSTAEKGCTVTSRAVAARTHGCAVRTRADQYGRASARRQRWSRGTAHRRVDVGWRFDVWRCPVRLVEPRPAHRRASIRPSRAQSARSGQATTARSPTRSDSGPRPPRAGSRCRPRHLRRLTPQQDLKLGGRTVRMQQRWIEDHLAV